MMKVARAKAIDANRIQESSIRSSSIISSEAEGELVAVEKFDGLGTAIDEKLLKEGGTLSGNLDVDGFTLFQNGIIRCIFAWNKK